MEQFSCTTYQIDKHYNEMTQESALCTGGLTLPIPLPNKSWEGPYSKCVDINLTTVPKAASRCNLNSVTKSDFEAQCLDPLGRGHGYKCVPFSGRWLFYPDDPDFPSYTVFIVYVVFCVLCCVLTVVLNLLNIILFMKSKKLQSCKTLVHACHMTFIDLLIGTVQLPLYIVLVFHSNEYSLKGNDIISYQKVKVIDEWYSRLDLLLLAASFMNLALLSIERCVAVIKPFWHMSKLTLRKLLLSVPAVWMYSLAVFFVYYYTVNKSFLFSFFAGFLFPTLIMTTCYMFIIYKMKITSKIEGSKTKNSKRNIENKVTRNLIVLIALFLLSWLPYFITMLLHRHKFYRHYDSVVVKSAIRWTKLLSYCHCFFDPILYAFSRPDIRKELVKLYTRRDITREESIKKMKTTRTTSLGLTNIASFK